MAVLIRPVNPIVVAHGETQESPPLYAEDSNRPGELAAVVWSVPTIAGITIDAATRVLSVTGSAGLITMIDAARPSGTPADTPAGTLFVTATLGTESATVAVHITTAAVVVHDIADVYRVRVGQAFPAFLPSIGPSDASLQASNPYSIVTVFAPAGRDRRRALPAGLTLNAATGAITGSPTTLPGITRTMHRLRVTLADSTTADIDFEIQLFPRIGLPITQAIGGRTTQGLRFTRADGATVHDLPLEGGTAPYTAVFASSPLPLAGASVEGRPNGIRLTLPALAGAGYNTTVYVDITDSTSPTPRTSTIQLSFQAGSELAPETFAITGVPHIIRTTTRAQVNEDADLIPVPGAPPIDNPNTNPTAGVTWRAVPVTGGGPFFRWPIGVSINPATGVISGEVSALNPPGVYEAPMHASVIWQSRPGQTGAYQIGRAQRDVIFVITATADLVVPTPAAIDTVVRTGTFDIDPSGGTPPYTYAASHSAVDGMVSVNGNTVTWTAPAGTDAWNTTVSVVVSDNASQRQEVRIPIRVRAAGTTADTLAFAALPPPGVFTAGEQVTRQVIDTAGGVVSGLAITSVVNSDGDTIAQDFISVDADANTVTASPTLNTTPPLTGSAEPYTVTLTAMDGAGRTGTLRWEVTVVLFAITDPGLIQAVPGERVDVPLTVQGGVEPITWSEGTGFPNWLNLTTDGRLVGVVPAAQSGDVTVTVTATDSDAPTPNTDSESVRVSVARVVLPRPADLTLVRNQAMEPLTLEARGGVEPYTYRDESTRAITGLALSTAGVLSGTPTGPARAGEIVRVRVTDSSTPQPQQAMTSFRVTVVQGSIVIEPVPDLTVRQGDAVNIPMVGAGPLDAGATVRWNLPSPPLGLRINSAGVIIGTIADDAVPGPYPVRVDATGEGADPATLTFTLTVLPSSVPLSLAGVSLAVRVGTEGSVAVVPVGGVPPYTFVWAGYIGLSLDIVDGLSITPGPADTATFTANIPADTPLGIISLSVIVTDSAGAEVTAELLLNVRDTGAFHLPTPPPVAIRHLQQIAVDLGTAVNAVGPVTYDIDGGDFIQLATLAGLGLTIQGNRLTGRLSDVVPTGVYLLTVTASDRGVPPTQTLTGPVYPRAVAILRMTVGPANPLTIDPIPSILDTGTVPEATVRANGGEPFRGGETVETRNTQPRIVVDGGYAYRWAVLGSPHSSIVGSLDGLAIPIVPTPAPPAAAARYTSTALLELRSSRGQTVMVEVTDAAGQKTTAVVPVTYPPIAPPKPPALALAAISDANVVRGQTRNFGAVASGGVPPYTTTKHTQHLSLIHI